MLAVIFLDWYAGVGISRKTIFCFILNILKPTYFQKHYKLFILPQNIVVGRADALLSIFPWLSGYIVVPTSADNNLVGERNPSL